MPYFDEYWLVLADNRMLRSIKLYFTVESNNCDINWAWRLGAALDFLIVAEQDVWICRKSPLTIVLAS